MTPAKLSIVSGNVSFSAEGSEAWLTEQLDKVLAALPTIADTAPPPNTSSDQKDTDAGASSSITKYDVSLAAHIKSKGGDGNQVRRFLATADWLRCKGTKSLKTSLIGSALKENHQSKLSNPSDCLSQNISKGFCEKDGTGFYITPEGLKELGY